MGQSISGLAIFILTLTVIGLLVWRLPSTSRIAVRIGQLLVGVAIARNGLFGGTNEIPKFAVIRIIFGFLVLNRIYWVIIYGSSEDWADVNFVLPVVIDIAAGAMLLIGIASQWALLILVVFQWQIGEHLLNSSTLGNDIAAILSVLLLLTMSGSRISIDRIIINRYPKIAKHFLYFEIDDENIVLSKFISLFSYWLVCLYSLAQHISEPAWIDGFAGPQLLANNFMSRYFETFEFLFLNSPVAILAAKVGLWIMIPWYGLLLPFVLLGGWLRTFIIGWGILFFLLSTLILQLGWLAEFEWLLWASVFLVCNTKVDVAYDDKCNLCDRTVNFVKRVDVMNNVRLRPASKNEDWLLKRGVAMEDALRDLHGWKGNSQRTYSGYNFYMMLCGVVPLLMPFWPILMLGRISRLGPYVYQFVAQRRIRAFGICTLPTYKKDWTSGTKLTQLRFPLMETVSLHVVFLGAFFLASIPVPYMGWSGVHTPLASAAHVYGMAPIDVFNQTDLRMAERWFTLRTENGELVPFLNDDGSRGIYLKSDRNYFGGALWYRRTAIQKSGCYFDDLKVQSLLRSIASLYSDKTGFQGDFVFTQFLEPLPDAKEISRLHFRPSEVETVCRHAFPID